MEEDTPMESDFSRYNGELTESMKTEPQHYLQSLNEKARAKFAEEIRAMTGKPVEVQVRTDTGIVNPEATISNIRPLSSAEENVAAQIQRMGYTDVRGVKWAVQQASGNKHLALSLLKQELEAYPGASSFWDGHPFMTCYCLGEGLEIPWCPGGCSSCLNTPQGSSAGYVIPSNDGLPVLGSAVEGAIFHPEKAGSSSSNTYAAIAPSPTYTTAPPVPAAAPPSPQPPRHRIYASPLPLEVRTALFNFVRNLAPAHGVRHFWNKVSEAMAEQKYKKSGDAWRIEWCRYGAYEIRFDERRAVFVDGMRERLELARCLDPKGREWMKEMRKEVEKVEKGKGKAKEM